MQIMEMIVNMDCHGCERKIRRALQNLDGVENIEIDMDMQKVTVTGWVDQEKVLKKIRTGKKADLWPFPNNHETVVFTQQYADMYGYHSDPSTYFHEQRPEIFTHNYYEPRYDNAYGRLEMPYSSTGVLSERASNAFSDENVNACSVM
ncbi:heavy metal-associated isoprenylated plant protein 45-like [Bidens hawaiensis]|uniref:heavy metal-associated isoprenylated plant protein 45-like n=1 Tax=Bidens hawaiensis TaxID=980011 RepID=UPI00404B15CE